MGNLGKLALFDAAKGEILREQDEDEEKEGTLRAAAFTGEGKTLAAFYGGRDKSRLGEADALLLWNVVTGERELRPLRGDLDRVSECVASPDGRVLAARDGGNVRLWNVTTGDAMRRLETRIPYVLATAFSPDGRTLALTDFEGAVHLWETASGRERGVLRGHQGAIDALAFSADGRRLFSGGRDGVVLAWDLTGRTRDARTPPTGLDEKGLEKLWDDLAGEDAVQAYQAVWTLAAVPERSVPFLKTRLRNNPATAAQIARWIVDLGDDDLATRERASAELRRLEDTAEPALSAALDGQPAPEERRRIEELLEAVKRVRRNLYPLDVRVVRALEALENGGDSTAREALARLAEGPETSLAREAKASLEHLRRRPTAAPPP
jgi:hypothetical protein